MKKSKDELQHLVDVHHLFGMNKAEIKEHLLTMHSVDPEAPIPPVSERAKKALSRFIETGKMPKWANIKLIH